MYYFILNPTSKSGRGLQIFRQLKPILTERNIPYKIYESRHPGHIRELVSKIMNKHAAKENPVNVILLGGDGTLNEALSGVSDFSKINFGYIPTGSSNDFARDLELPKSSLEILERILKNSQEDRIRLMDIGELTYVNQFSENEQDNTQSATGETAASSADTSFPSAEKKGEPAVKRYFAVSSGIGFDAAVCEEANSSPLKNTLNKLKLGKSTYLGIAVKQIIQTKSVSCTLTLDDDTKICLDRFLFIASMLHQYEGGGFQFCPGADATDGVMDLCVVGKIAKPVIFLALPTAFFGRHYLFPSIKRYRAKEVEIKTSVPLWVHTDGEVSRKADHIRLCCHRQALRLLV